MAEELQATQAAQQTVPAQPQQPVQIPEVAKPVSKFGQQKKLKLSVQMVALISIYCNIQVFVRQWKLLIIQQCLMVN